VLIAILIGAPFAAMTSFTLVICASALISLIAVPIAFSMHEPRGERAAEHENYLQTVSTGIRDAWQRPALRYIMLFSGLLNAATFAPLIFVQPFLDEHGVVTENLGLWQAPVRAAGVVAALLVARIVGRIGERGAFFAMPAGLAVAMFALAGIDALWVYGVFLIVGVVAGIQNPVLATYINRRIPSDRRATMLSVQSVIASLMLVFLEPLGGLLADGLGLQGMFLAFGLLITVFCGAVLYLWNRAEQAELHAEAEANHALERATEPVAVS
jgi:predicted MFS family arabinose efflux permease